MNQKIKFQKWFIQIPLRIIIILLLVFLLINSGISYQKTKNEILNLEAEILITEKSLTEKEKERESLLEEFRMLNCSEEFIRWTTTGYFTGARDLSDKYLKQYGEEKFSKCSVLGPKIWKSDYILQDFQKAERKLKEKKQIPFSSLWLKNFFQNEFFVVTVTLLVGGGLVIVILGVLKSVIIKVAIIKKQVEVMPTFQKYLVVLNFCILVILILILLKMF